MSKDVLLLTCIIWLCTFTAGYLAAQHTQVEIILGGILAIIGGGSTGKFISQLEQGRK